MNPLTLMLSILVIQAPAQNPCGLLTEEEIHTVDSQLKVSDGVAGGVQSLNSSTCHYTWGTGIRRETLTVAVNSAPRMFGGAGADAIKQTLTSSVVPGSADEAIPDTGNAAVFNAYSSLYAGASAYVKDRILQVQLDGLDATGKKAQLIALLKAAAARM